MTAMILVLATLMQAAGAATPAKVREPLLPYCPAANEQSDELAYGLTTSADYADVRADYSLQVTAPENVRVLTDPGDAAACQTMQNYAAQQAQAHGGNLSGTTTVFYKAGSYYLAIVTIPLLSNTPTADGGVQIHTRFLPVYVFDSNFNPLVAVAL